MNKTVKTIAWICLVLGLMGVAADAVMAVRWQTAKTQIVERIESGDLPEFKELSGDAQDIDEKEVDKRSPRFPGSYGSVFKRGGGRGRLGENMLRGRPGGLGAGGIRFGFPLLLVISGPILAVVGAVILIVNREPKEKEVKVKAKKAKKETND